MTDSYRGDSCGSFEFLSKSRNRRGSESDEDDQRLFFPQRSEEKEAILRQIATLNDGNFTEESRESSAQPENVNKSELNVNKDDLAGNGFVNKGDLAGNSNVKEGSPDLGAILNPLSKSSTEERSIPLVVAVADAARNPRIRGKPSRLRDLQQPVPMEENPHESSESK